MGIVDDLQRLEQLRSNGTLTEDEFVQAKSRLLADEAELEPAAPRVAVELAGIRYQNELLEIDRKWQLDREQFEIIGKYGRRYTPTFGMGLLTILGGGGFGAFWTVTAFTITRASGAMMQGSGLDLIGNIFPLFGVAFTLGSIIYGFYIITQAQKYQDAYAAYQAKRAQAESNHVTQH